MKTLISISALLLLSSIQFSCAVQQDGQSASTKDNSELVAMVIKDQEMRNADSNEPMEPTDKIHRLRVMELLSEGKIITNTDKTNAALILQHTALTYCNNELKSTSPENYYMAYILAKSAFDAGDRTAGQMTAAAYDRFLLFTECYQKYGTQKLYDETTEEMVWGPIDPNTTDEQRKVYGIPPLAELKKEGVTIVDEIQSYDYGKLVHILDAEGNKIELWEAVD